MQRLTEDQIALIQDKLAQGMRPVDIANHFARLNDLEPDQIALIRSAAGDLMQGADPKNLLT